MKKNQRAVIESFTYGKNDSERSDSVTKFAVSPAMKSSTLEQFVNQGQEYRNFFAVGKLLLARPAGV